MKDVFEILRGSVIMSLGGIMTNLSDLLSNVTLTILCQSLSIKVLRLSLRFAV